MAAFSDPGTASLVKVTAAPLPGAVTDRLAAVGKALGDPHRIEILHLLALASGPVCVLDLEHHLGAAQSTVSYHLKVLVDSGVCDREPRGRWTYYSVRAEVLAEFRHQLERLIHFPDSLQR